MIENKSINLNASHLILGAIILFLLWLLLKPAKIDTSKYDKDKKQIDSLNTVLVNLSKKQLELNKSILYYQNKIDSLDNQINKTNQNLINIRLYYDKKIDSITNYTPSQLNDFFAKRYK